MVYLQKVYMTITMRLIGLHSFGTYFVENVFPELSLSELHEKREGLTPALVE
jgi:hypothetical protein